ncbi:cyclin N-terminal domain-containing protein 1-like [Mercenaria mercenaria]|uniref:cyclin N-terminal domain-containing protein 1-like n=1 Tax=Mercenaria mercenaria TaxID=6596 RepID=UPI00234F1695|nr:cyclin N-terminal domain-containing protein 1-like [Mercenaria mercenaria]
MDRIAAEKSSAVFGTPPEPLFNHKLCGASPEMLKDWIVLLTEKNLQAVDNAKPVQGASVVQDSVQFLFLTCDRMKMSSEVKYLSLELFDRFMVQHVQDLHEHVVNTSGMKTRGKDWHEIQNRVRNQVVLRVVSCIQIASKLTSHYRILSPHKARRFLIDSGHRYNTESILQSELRILKTLNFHVSVPSPLVYLECLLEAIGNGSYQQTNRYHGVWKFKVPNAMEKNLSKVDYYEEEHLLREELVVIKSIKIGFYASTELCYVAEECFASVRADKMLLMVTLITAGAYIIDRDSHEKVMVCLSKITSIPTEDISDFASVILKTLMESSED